MYREGAVTDRMYQKWFAKFHAGDFLLDDAPCGVDQLKLIATRLRTINVIPRGSQPTYSKHPNQ